MLKFISKIFGNKNIAAESIEDVTKPKRFNDAIFIVRQDNENCRLPIEATNDLAVNLIKCSKEDLVNHDFRELLPLSVKEILNDNIEFEEIGKSIDEVLRRINKFRMVDSSGLEIPLRVRVVQALSSVHSPRFQIIVNDSSLVESLLANREKFKTDSNNSNIIDQETNIFTKQSMLNDIDLISSYAVRNEKDSCFAIFCFKDYESLKQEKGETGAKQDVKNLIGIIQSSMRDTDFIGHVDESSIIVLFTETPRDNIKVPLDRIYSKMPLELKSHIRTTYNNIKPDRSAEEQIKLCSMGMAGNY